MFLMWGYDGETMEDIEATIEHVKRCNPDIFLTTVAYPIKDTPYFDKVAARIACSTRSWAVSTDRDYRIKGRHSRSYYRHADRWLRNEVAAYRLEPTDPDTARTKRMAALEARRDMRAAEREVEA